MWNRLVKPVLLVVTVFATTGAASVRHDWCAIAVTVVKYPFTRDYVRIAAEGGYSEDAASTAALSACRADGHPPGCTIRKTWTWGRHFVAWGEDPLTKQVSWGMGGSVQEAFDACSRNGGFRCTTMDSHDHKIGDWLSCTAR